MNSKDFEVAPCLAQGPLSASARKMIAAGRELGEGRAAQMLRAWAVPFLFDGMERIFATTDEPNARVSALLEDLANVFTQAQRTGLVRVGGDAPAAADGEAQASDPVEQVTGKHYGKLFEAFSPTSFWDEPTRLLGQRLERNGIDLSRLPEAEVLDAGCGGGRYTVAWKKLGAKRATGVDISSIGLASARKRVSEAKLEGVEFIEGSVLDLPVGDRKFDVVYSNGVLHHTTDWKKGVKEIVRVLKPGGLGFLYLIENPGGIFWDTIEILRLLLAGASKDVARATLSVMGIPASRIFYMLDHVMVPINVRLTPKEIEDALIQAGATGVRRLERGVDFDRVEQIHKRIPYAEAKYGVGENRFVFTRA